MFSELHRLEAQGTVRRLPSGAAAVAVPPAASTDVLLHVVTPRQPPLPAGTAAPVRTPPMRETVHIHRIVPKADFLLQRDGMKQLLQHLLHQLEAVFRDPHIHQTSSSSVTLQLLESQTPERQAELQKCLFEELQSLKANEGQRLLQLNVERVELKIPQVFAGNDKPTAAAGDGGAAPQQVMLRSSSRGGCWLEPEATPGFQRTLGYEGDCDMHSAAAAEMLQQQQQPQQQRSLMTTEASTAENSAAPSPLLSEIQTPENGMSREVMSTETASGEPSLRSAVSSLSREATALPPAWEKGETAAAAAEAERTAPLVPLKGVSDGQLAAKRAAAQRAGSTYIYDFLGLVRNQIQQQWQDTQRELTDAGDNRKLQIPEKLMEVTRQSIKEESLF